MSTYAVEYVYPTDRDEEMGEVRPKHRAFLRSLFEAGTLSASGPWVDESVPGALILIHATSLAEAEEIMAADPFFKAGFLVKRTIRAWDPVIGVLAGK